MPHYTTTVEIGHTYAPDRLVHLGAYVAGGEWPRFVDDLRARRLRDLAANVTGRVLRVALLDDVAALDAQRLSPQDSWRHAAFINVSHESLAVGTRASVVQRESTFVHAAHDIVETIREMDLPEGYRLTDGGDKIVQGSGSSRLAIPLTGFRGIDHPEHPSCAVLDLAWMQYRQTLAPDAVTFLAEQYEGQQRQVAALARLFPAMAEQGAISSVFLDSEQRVVNELHWQ